MGFSFCAVGGRLGAGGGIVRVNIFDKFRRAFDRVELTEKDLALTLKFSSARGDMNSSF